VQATLQQLPALVAEMRGTLHTIDREVRGVSGTGQQALVQSSASLQGALAAVQSLAQTLQSEGTGTLSAARTAAQSTTTAMDNAGALLDPQGETMQQLQHAMDDFAATAARLRSLSERVDRDPAVLVRGR
jgi:paraquat-inducible protein B